MKRYRLTGLILFVFTLTIFVLGAILSVLFTPGIRFSTPEAAVENFWNARNKQNYIRAALSFSDIRLVEASLAVKGMLKTKIQTYGIEIMEKTILDERTVHLKYVVVLRKGKKYTTGNVLSYNQSFGWRITAPASEAPK